MNTRQLGFLGLLTIGLASVPAIGAAAAITFDVLVSDEEDSGDGTPFTILEGPAAIDALGRTYFEALTGTLGVDSVLGFWRADNPGELTQLLRSTDAAPDVFTNGTAGTLANIEFDSGSNSSRVNVIVGDDGGILFVAPRGIGNGEIFELDSGGTLTNIARSANSFSDASTNETAADGLTLDDGRGNRIRGFVGDNGSRNIKQNSAGSFAYAGRFATNEILAGDAGLETSGIFTGSSRATTRAVAFDGAAAVGTTETWDNLRLIAVAADGVVFFRGNLSDGSEGIWRDRAGVVSLVLRTGAAAPGVAGGAFLGMGGGLSDTEISVNASGEIAVLGYLGDPAQPGDAQLTIWRGAPDNLTATILGNDTVTVSVQTDDGAVNANFQLSNNRFEGILLSDNGDVAISGQYEDADQSSIQQVNGVFRLAAGTAGLTQLASGGSDFAVAAINDQGQALFNTGTSFQTLYAYDPQDGTTEVLRTGQATDFGTVGSFQLIGGTNGASSGSSTSFNDAGQLAVAVLTQGGTTTGIDHIVRVNLTFEEVFDNLFRFSGACGDGNWHSDCSETNWVDSDGQAQTGSPGDIANANVLIDGLNVVLSDRPAQVETLTVTGDGSLTVREALSIDGAATIANLMLEASLTLGGATTLINPDIGGDLESGLAGNVEIEGLDGIWRAGRLSGPSRIIVEADSRLTVADNVALGGRLENDGALDLGSNDLRLDVNAQLVNDGTLMLGAGGSITSFDTDIISFFTNNGVISKTGSSASSTLTGDFTQSATGSISVAAGELLIEEGSFDLGGSLIAAGGSSIRIRPGTGDTATLANLRVQGEGATVLEGSGYDVTGVLTVNGGSDEADTGNSGLVLAASEALDWSALDSLNVTGTTAGRARLTFAGDFVNTLPSDRYRFENARIDLLGGVLELPGTGVLANAQFELAANSELALRADPAELVMLAGDSAINGEGRWLSASPLVAPEQSTASISASGTALALAVATDGQLTLGDGVLATTIETDEAVVDGVLALSGGAELVLGDTGLQLGGELRKIGSGMAILRGDVLGQSPLGGSRTVSVDDGQLHLEGSLSQIQAIELGSGSSLNLVGGILSLDSSFRARGEGELILEDVELRTEANLLPATILDPAVVLNFSTFSVGPGATPGSAGGLTLRNTNTELSDLESYGLSIQGSDNALAVLNTEYDETGRVQSIYASDALFNHRRGDLLVSELRTESTGLSVDAGAILTLDRWRSTGTSSAFGEGRIQVHSLDMNDGAVLQIGTTVQTELLLGFGGLIEISEGGHLNVSREFFSGLINQANLRIQRKPTLFDGCGTVCLAAAPPGALARKASISSAPRSAQASSSTAGLTLGADLRLINVEIDNVDGDVFVQGPLELEGTSRLINRLAGVTTLAPGSVLVADLASSGIENSGLLKITGDAIFGYRVPDGNTGRVFARADSGQLFNTLQVALLGQLGSWDLDDVRVEASLGDALTGLRSGSHVRLARGSRLLGLERSLSTTGGSFVLDSGSSLTYDRIESDRVAVDLLEVSGKIQLIDTDLVANRVAVNPGGVFQSNAVVDGTLSNSGGTVIVGASPGTLTINGDYEQAAGSVLSLELGGTTAGVDYDQIVINGTARIAAGSLITIALLDTPDGLFVPENGTQFDLIVADSFEGDADVASLIRFMNAPSGFRFDLEEAMIGDQRFFALTTFLGSELAALPGLDPRTAALAATLDALSLSNVDEDLTTFALGLDALPPGAAQQVAVAALNPSFSSLFYDASYAAGQRSQRSLARLMRAMAGDGAALRDHPTQSWQRNGRGNGLANRNDWLQLASALGGDQPMAKHDNGVTTLWEVSYDDDRFRSPAERQGLDDVGLTGATVSAGVALARGNFGFGALAQLGDHRVDSRLLTNSDSETLSLGAFASYALRPAHQLALSLAYGDGELSYQRGIGAGLATRLRASVDTTVTSASLSYAGVLSERWGGPMAALRYLRSEHDAFSERGGAGALRFESAEAHYSSALVGWSASRRLGDRWHLDGTLGYERLFRQSTADAAMTYVGAPGSLVRLRQPTRSRNLAMLDLQLRYQVADRVSAYLQAAYQGGPDQRQLGLGGGVLLRF